MKELDRLRIIKEKKYSFETDKEEAFYIKGIKDAEEYWQLKNCNLQNVMPMFADDSNAGNIKRAELIADYKSKIPNWTGDYGQGFADAFNWLCRTFKANLV